jgi:RHS repeat-associated protein
MSLGYMGKPYDTATGMYNYGYRDYVPEVARFTTLDPIRDGRNWFAYVNNDPVNYVDLWGLETKDEFRLLIEIDILAVGQTPWGQNEGKDIVTGLKQMNNDGKIIEEDLNKNRNPDDPRTIMEAYRRETGTLAIDINTTGTGLIDALVHGGTHKNDHGNGLPQGIEREYTAFENQYTVNQQMGIDKPQLSRSEIDNLYKDSYIILPEPEFAIAHPDSGKNMTYTGGSGKRTVKETAGCGN